MKSRTILIVDDDADLRETLMEQLALCEEFEVLQERIHPADSRINMLAEKTPASFVVFDAPKVDAPCTTKTAHVAYILQALKDDRPGESYNDGQYSMYISVTDQDITPQEDANPVKTLRMRYDAWKKARAGVSK